MPQPLMPRPFVPQPLGFCFLFAIGLMIFGQMAARATEPRARLAEALVFHAPFDSGFDARLGAEPGIFTAESYERTQSQPGNHRSDVTIIPDGGRYGGALRFGDNAGKVLYFRGSNIPFSRADWSGTVSFWLRLDPDKGLKPGYSDPIQITDKAWNDSGMWVDFDEKLPRACRLGMFPRMSVWNPDNIAWEQFPPELRPMVPVLRPAFNDRLWTHVAFTFQDVNASGDEISSASFYLHGIHQGTLRRKLEFDWDPDKVAIMLGLSFIGDFDDLTIFNRALSGDEVEFLRTLSRGAAELAR